MINKEDFENFMKQSGVEFSGYNHYTVSERPTKYTDAYSFTYPKTDLKIRIHYVGNHQFGNRVIVKVGNCDRRYPKNVIAISEIEWEIMKRFIMDLIESRNNLDYISESIKLWESQDELNSVDLSKFKKYQREVRLDKILG